MRKKTRGQKDPNDPLQAFRNVQKHEEPHSYENVREHEENAADLIGGRRHAGSGASVFLKSDCSSDRYQLEAKQTEKYSLSVKLEWLTKITREALGMGKVPLLHIRFLENKPDVERDWVLVPQSEFKELLKRSGVREK